MKQLTNPTACLQLCSKHFYQYLTPVTRKHMEEIAPFNGSPASTTLEDLLETSV